MTRKILKHVANRVFDEWVGKKIILTQAYVNSFEDCPGHMRHDVFFLAVSKTHETNIETTRRLLKKLNYQYLLP